MLKKIVYFLIAIAVSLFIYFLYYNQYDFLNSIDTKLQDSKFRLRYFKKASDKVVLVAIDGKSIDKYGRWPWDRKLFAKLIDKLNDYGVKTIALDVVFSEPSNPDSDAALSKAIYREQNVILGYFFRDTISEEEAEAAMERLPDFSIENINLLEEVDKLPILSFRSAETNIDEIAEGAYSKGFFSVFPDRDGILRRVHLVADFNGFIMPSLALSALSHYLDEEITLYVDRYGINRLLLGKELIPVDMDGSIPVNFYGTKGTITTISAADILEGKVDSNLLKNKLIFLGITEIGVGDYQATPVDSSFPGTEIHCTFASNVLQNFFLIKDSKTVIMDIATIFLLPLIVAVISVLFRRGIYSFVTTLFFSLAYFYFNFKMFDVYNFQLSTIYPFSSVMLSFILIEIYKNFVVEQKSKYLKKAFSSYISEDLVEEILQNPDRLKLGGEKRDITVLFSDIRGFTSISEELDPESLVSLLNSFLGPATEIILKNRGMLDKYIGDAIMAIFNAPVNLKNHRDMAVKSSMEIVSLLDRLNDDFVKKGWPKLDISVGINSGDAVVGNLGTERRFDYTAIGDTVNLASRLEGLNKYYGTKILISEFTKAGLNEDFPLRLVDTVRVKGKNKPVDIFEVVVRKVDDEFFKLYEEGLAYYREFNFEQARKRFEILAERYQDYLAEVYLERMASFKGAKEEFDYITTFYKK
ncbi:adenylate/guanylate cyclase domain-containing protein [Deferribacter autotrophicus]|uniref:Adenylate/guanylate cyclase domain-containing protein n=1 Tax=Deferribacter autotrophicus TaxID=500465 RepID=A0A5A8F3R9_9BACT|nr:adenylate/guanylate cyclase domain-containing protein [Deferribacter autotrophicus]KAA0258111.1 adenylate/guanylate cyclase domain-containing protein [Deferribacter autotrophicus]